MGVLLPALLLRLVSEAFGSRIYVDEAALFLDAIRRILGNMARYHLVDLGSRSLDEA